MRQSELFPYFDAVLLSCEQGIQKPDEEIFIRCIEQLHVKPEECLYVGDGGSRELETARKLGMTAAQAVWYLR
ncbi:MAG: HAD family hydrolase [Lachnospiraceae bacterium]|nr:HAD family hydrolase [Lachnospiraceae bacterium]